MSRAFVSYSTMERAWLAVDGEGRSAGSFADEASARAAAGLPPPDFKHGRSPTAIIAGGEAEAIFYFSDASGWWRQRVGEPPCGPFASFAACVEARP